MKSKSLFLGECISHASAWWLMPAQSEVSITPPMPLVDTLVFTTNISISYTNLKYKVCHTLVHT